MNWLSVDDLKEFSPDKWIRKTLIQSDQMVSNMMCYEPGQETPTHAHKRQDEIFFIVEGRGTVTVADEEVAVGPTSVVFVPAGTPHSVRPAGDSRLVLFYVKAPGSDRPPRT